MKFIGCLICGKPAREEGQPGDCEKCKKELCEECCDRLNEQPPSYFVAMSCLRCGGEKFAVKPQLTFSRDEGYGRVSYSEGMILVCTNCGRRHDVYINKSDELEIAGKQILK